jgi:hypothetical protein
LSCTKFGRDRRAHRPGALNSRASHRRTGRTVVADPLPARMAGITGHSSPRQTWRPGRVPAQRSGHRHRSPPFVMPHPSHPGGDVAMLCAASRILSHRVGLNLSFGPDTVSPQPRKEVYVIRCLHYVVLAFVAGINEYNTMDVSGAWLTVGPYPVRWRPAPRRGRPMIAGGRGPARGSWGQMRSYDEGMVEESQEVERAGVARPNPEGPDHRHQARSRGLRAGDVAPGSIPIR